jgi:peptide/nickel transport system permease protein
VTLAATGAAEPPGRAAALWRGLPLPARAAGVVILGYVLVALTAPIWAPHPAAAVLIGPPFAGPSAAFPFGTDNLGRDVFSRVVLGSRAVLAMAASATALSVLLGGLVGLLLGYRRGWVDELAMRAIDILISIPPLVLALLIISALGNSTVLVVLTVALLFAPRVARTARAATLAIVTEDYVAAAVTRGEGAWSIALRELLPNVAGTLLVEFAIRCGFAIVFIGGLGFLGFGAPPPTPEWGLMINEGRASISASLWPVMAPAAAMAGLVIAVNLFTDGVARLIGQPVSRGPRQ